MGKMIHTWIVEHPYADPSRYDIHEVGPDGDLDLSVPPIDTQPTRAKCHRAVEAIRAASIFGEQIVTQGHLPF